MENVEASNSNIEMIRGDPKVALKKLAWPLIFTLVLNMVYNLVDRIWVAGLGAGPLAAIGFILPIFMMISGIGNGFGSGANSVISRYIGAKDKDNASNSAIHSILIGIVISILIPLLLLPFLGDLLVMMGAGNVLSYASDYATIIILGSFTLVLNGILSSQLRAEGDIKRASRALIITGVLNMAIDPIFIYTFNLGVRGAAIATILSALVATVLMFYWILVKKDTYVNVEGSYFKFSPTIIREIISVAIPGTVEEVIMSSVAIMINATLAVIATTEVIAAYTAAWSIVDIAMMIPLGIATAAITVAGVAYGARDIRRVDFVCNYSIKLSMILVVVVFIVIEIFAPQIAMMFSYSSPGAFNGLVCDVLRILALFILTVPAGICCAFVFQAIGRGMISLILTILREVVFVLIALFILVDVMHLGAIGVYLCMTLGGLMGGIVAIVAFKYYIRKIEAFEGASI